MFLQEIPDCFYEWNSIRGLSNLLRSGCPWTRQAELLKHTNAFAINSKHNIFLIEYFFSSQLVNILHLKRADWAYNTDLNWLLALEASFIHMANILGICPFRSWCVRKIKKISFCAVFPDVLFAKGNSCHCHSYKPCVWKHLMSDPAMKFCGVCYFSFMVVW